MENSQSELQTQTSPMISQQPDVIPTQYESVQSDIYETVAPPAAFSSNENGHAVERAPEIVQSVQVENEQIYSNIDCAQQESEEQTQEQIYSNIETMQPQIESQSQDDAMNPTALTGSEDCDLAEYIEDTKIQALALYDYQASAEDEISFDPNDIITHIEKVS